MLLSNGFGGHFEHMAPFRERHLSSNHMIPRALLRRGESRFGQKPIPKADRQWSGYRTFLRKSNPPNGPIPALPPGLPGCLSDILSEPSRRYRDSRSRRQSRAR